jgi:hypothetical protein
MDIVAPSEELADKMEAELINLGYTSAEYGDDLGAEGFLFQMMIDSSELKQFNQDYTRIKRELK